MPAKINFLLNLQSKMNIKTILRLRNYHILFKMIRDKYRKCGIMNYRYDRQKLLFIQILA